MRARSRILLGGVRGRLLVRLGSVTAAVVLALLVGASVATAAPVFEMTSVANSTAAPGQTLAYLVRVNNKGDADTGGNPYMVTVALPPGLSASSATSSGSVTWDCASLVVGARSFSCTSTDTLYPEGINLNSAPLTVVANVENDASGTLTTSFEVTGGGSEPDSAVDATRISDDPPGFGVAEFDGGPTDNTLGLFTQAGGRPFSFTTAVEFTLATHSDYGPAWPVEPFKDVIVELPPGLVGNPTVVERCAASEIAVASGSPNCPAEAQVGVLTMLVDGDFISVAIYNMDPPPDAPARFGINISGSVAVFDAHVRSGSDYGLTVSAANAPEIFAFGIPQVRFWGSPADSVHTSERACPGQGFPQGTGPRCESQLSVRPFLRMPTSCTPPGVGLETRVRADSWAHPGDFKSASFVTHEPPGYPYPPEDWGAPQGTTGCGLVPFDPELEGTPATPAHANEPSGFTFDLTIPQNDDEIGQSDLRKAVVTLPKGVRISPPSAMGLQGCSSVQIALRSDAKPTCPDASKIGTVTVETPLLEEPLTGNVFLATPFDNPSNSLMALYLVVEGPGVIIKLDGQVQLDPDTGQITTTFDDNPQLPFSKLHLQLDDGPRAPLVLPRKCGTYTTHAVLTGWSGKTVQRDSSFTIDRGADGGPCPTKPEFTPDFEAGTISPVAGSYSPFVLNLARDDADEELRTLSLDMPQGMLARINGVPQCPAAQAAAGTCGESTRVGTVTTGAGAGTLPFFLDGGVYFSGPYKGAPFSLSIVVPAKAGPFDLGTVVVRAALHIDRHTASVKVVSDPLPTVLEGVRLQVRDVRVFIDRKRFFKNATSCKEKRIRGTIGSTEGSTAHVGSRYQMLDCASLRLRPRLTLRVGGKGRTRAGGSTPLVATLRQGPGQSGLKSVSVQLPLVLNGKLDVIGDACSREEFEEDAAKNCANAKTGVAVARTPLLEKPLRGSVYFVDHPGRGLPNMVVALRGEVDIDLVSKIRIPSSNKLGTVFRAIPDVPVSSFKLKLFAGENGSVGTTANLCSRKARRATAHVRFVGHNGDRIDRRQRLKIAGCAKKRNR